MTRFSFPGVSPISYGGMPPPLSYGSIAGYGDPMYGPMTMPVPTVSSAPGIAPPTPLLNSVPGVGAGPQMTAPQMQSQMSPVAGANGVGGVAGADGNKTGFFGKDGFTLSDLGSLTEIIGGFGNLWNGFQMNKLAKDTLAFQKKSYDTNLTNSISSYNLALEDRMNSRYAQNNRSQSEADTEIARHRLEK